MDGTGSSNAVYLGNISSPVYNTAAATFTAPFTTTQLSSTWFGFPSQGNRCAVPITNVTIDSSAHLAFFSGEFCAQDARDPNQSNNGTSTPVGVAQLPTTSTNSPQFGDYAFVNLPPLPDGTLWDEPLDPHVAATLNINGCPDCGEIFNIEKTYLAIVDLRALLIAPRSTDDAHTVDPTYDLLAHHVLTYIPTGFAPDTSYSESRFRHSPVR